MWRGHILFHNEEVGPPSLWAEEMPYVVSDFVDKTQCYMYAAINFLYIYDMIGE
jgi:hypothetical protein